MENSFSIISTMLLLLFVLDPFGNIPLLLSILKNATPKQRYKIIIRESIIGLMILMVFFFFGEKFLNIFHLQTESITIAGGIIFFIISLKMIFPNAHGDSIFATKEEDPLVVPIAMPLIAGPGALATILVLVQTNQQHLPSLFVSLFLAWLISGGILVFSPLFYKVLKNKGLTALERLMGMLLLIMAVQMFIDGIKGLVNTYM
jgi:multiple antibiotic resistance protein